MHYSITVLHDQRAALRIKSILYSILFSVSQCQRCFLFQETFRNAFPSHQSACARGKRRIEILSGMSCERVSKKQLRLPTRSDRSLACNRLQFEKKSAPSGNWEKLHVLILLLFTKYWRDGSTYPPPVPMIKLDMGVYSAATWSHPPGAAHKSTTTCDFWRNSNDLLSWTNLKAARER